MKNNNLTSLDNFIDKEFGEKGYEKRDSFEYDYEVFKLGILLEKARKEKGLTQEQVAKLAGTNKTYISKLEKNLKDISFSKLQHIITRGLGGQLEVSIKF